ncbi:MAG: hypothetical protein L3J05_05375, partial [Robiginitomaculum sp.]|nr:hypothetical protein [Robiginitomaculum sp.]
MNTSVVFDPVLPIWVIISLTVLILIAATLGQWRGLKSFILRAVAAFLLCGALLNPQKLLERRTPLPDIALVLNDNSESMKFADREATAKSVRARLTDELTALGNMEIVEIVIPPGKDGTRMVQALIDGLAQFPAERIAGVFAITDGQVHDLPETPGVLLPSGVPFHSLIVGDKDARDRRLDAIITPKYGMVGE